MGHPAKGCVVPKGVQRFFADTAVLHADLMCPNVLELGVIAGGSVGSTSECVQAARAVLARGPKMVLVKHLAHAGLDPEQSFEMLLVTPAQTLHVSTPLLPFDRPPVGTGDLTSGMFLVKLLQGYAPQEALEHTAAAYHAVMQTTLEMNQYELQTVAAQDEIAAPTRSCLLYTSDAADEEDSVDLGGRRVI
eukprot:TRINITY_DN39791_c0_g1_i1.p1 TRINITY_DN39791_c0_g1~~TRINITY_DN39791_c0_g1_i1.p1  ORF type:complete len:191 (+),score=59.21 TRINITY_DN39791_c0_g1_i1:307-879(+)